MLITTRRTHTLAAAAAALALVGASAAASPAGAAGGQQAKAKTAKPSASTPAQHKRAIRQFRRALRSEAPTAAVAHYRGEFRPAPGSAPWSVEGWVEFGGGDRYRYVQVPPRGEGQPGERQIVWGRGPYWAVTDVMRTDRGLKQVTNVGYTDPAVAYDSVVLGLRYADDAQALFDTAPAGPTIDGKPTRAVPVALPFPTGLGTHDITWLLDATTRKPVRLSDRLAFDDGTVMNDSTTDFSLWEQLPAGTAADVLGGEVPMTATIQSTP